jgi:hypothetical protein
MSIKPSNSMVTHVLIYGWIKMETSGVWRLIVFLVAHQLAYYLSQRMQPESTLLSCVRKYVSIEAPEGLVDCMGRKPSETHKSRDLLLIYDSEEQIRSLKPDMNALADFDHFAVTACLGY